MTESYPHFEVQETAGRLRDRSIPVEWAVGQIPEEWTHALPDFLPQHAWTVAMNLGHLIVYDEKIALPILKSIASRGDGTEATFSGRPGSSAPMEDWFFNDANALSESPIAELRTRLRTARETQAQLVESFSDERFNARVSPLWGMGRLHSTGWIATKSFQHT